MPGRLARWADTSKALDLDMREMRQGEASKHAPQTLPEASNLEEPAKRESAQACRFISLMNPSKQRKPQNTPTEKSEAPKLAPQNIPEASNLEDPASRESAEASRYVRSAVSASWQDPHSEKHLNAWRWSGGGKPTCCQSKHVFQEFPDLGEWCPAVGAGPAQGAGPCFRSRNAERSGR
ncbi:hypothetical protein SCOR_02750 [Sulfidibacter corallicola]